MAPGYSAITFGILALAASRAFGRTLVQASSRGWTCTIDDNPMGLCLIVCGKAVCLGFSIANVLHTLGLAGDPVAHIKHARPFLP
jgi:hypothetical protein